VNSDQPPTPNPQPRTRARRPPLAEVDTTALADAVRAGRWGEAGPWLALLAGFGLVLAGMISFFWLSAQVSGNLEDRWLIVPLGLGLAWFLWQRFAAQRGFALGLIAALAALTAGTTLLWIVYYEAIGREIWFSLIGVLLVCGLGILVGLLGLNRLGGEQGPGNTNP
jgi:hypothetical protein